LSKIKLKQRKLQAARGHMIQAQRKLQVFPGPRNDFKGKKREKGKKKKRKQTLHI